MRNVIAMSFSNRLDALIAPALMCCCMGAVLNADTVRFDGSIFGTTYHIEARSESKPIDGQQLRDAVEARLNEIDERMSTWKSESEVSRFNRWPADQWFPVSNETALVVRSAKEINKLSHGFFDITVAPLLRLWNFGAAADEHFQLPNSSQITAALANVGSQHLVVETNPPRLKKMVELLEVDLSAIAKGYAVDAVCETVAAAGGDHFMVEIGGEVRARGSNAEGTNWRIGIESPTPNSRGVDSIAQLRDEAMATSGDYRNFFESDGKRYSHTVNPSAGRPVESEITAVTVFAKTCMEADALATTLMAMGNEAVAWANERQIEAIFFKRHENSVAKVVSASFDPSRLDPVGTERSSKSTPFGSIFGATAVVFGLAVFAMSIGVVLSNRQIRGTCGGIASLEDGATSCELCARPPADCPEGGRRKLDGVAH